MATQDARRVAATAITMPAPSSTSTFTVAMRLPMILSVGVARRAGEDGHYRKTEWLASLKIL